MTVAQYLNHWLEADIDRRVAARTAAQYRGIVEKNLIPRLGHVPVRKLTAVHIEAFEAELQRAGWVKARAKKKIKKRRRRTDINATDAVVRVDAWVR
jgi:hypothetical protein